MTKITGAGGGGGGGGKGGGGGGSSTTYTPTQEKDNLDSRQYARLIDLISEGEIEGLKNGNKSIFLNNVPLQNEDNSYNFKNVTVTTRTGTQDQGFIADSPSVENALAVGVTVQKDTPVVRSVTDTTVDAVSITITVPVLQKITDKGDIVGASARLQIDVQYNGGGYTNVKDDTIKGRTGDQYQRDYLIELTGAFPVDIRVTRITADSTSPKLQNAFSWTSYTEITYAKLRYPNSALVALRVDAEQFSSIPLRSYLIRGIKVAIPSNATVDSTNGSLTYAGVWDGTFGAAAWCSDPAWILWDLLTSTRYGFGDHIQAAQLDKWAFYSASQYCSELVPNGFGSQEPRFSCNVNIQTAEQAYKLINDLCSTFRAMPYWSTGALTISQDRPLDPAYLFTLANVSEEGFSYQGGALKGRPTVAVVSYLDLELRDVAYEVVEDQAAIAKYGVVTTEISAFACTSRGQAARIGEWVLYSEQYESEVVTFTASIDAGVMVRPGQVINISDPMRAGSRRGGRIKSATTTDITIDDATGLPSSGGTLSVILSNGTVETKSVSSRTGAVITVSAAFSTAPNANSIWIYETSTLQTSTWRVLSVQEQDGAKYAISALAYNSSKYDYIELDRPLQQRDTTDLNVLPEAPTDLALSETLYLYQDQVRAKVIASWKPVVGVNHYQVNWRKDDGNWATAEPQGPDYEILDITPGVFDFEVYSVSPTFKLSTNALTGTISALGKTAAPANVVTFSAVIDPDIGATLTWDPISDLDLQGYEIWEGTAFGVGTKLGLFAATAKKVGLMPTGTTTWYIKALDTSEVYSDTAASTSLTIAGAPAPTTSGSFEGENFTLGWTKVVGSLATDSYEIRYGTTSDTWSTATSLATTKGTAYTTKGSWLGTRRFFVAAVDLKGNIGTDGYYDAIVTAPSQPTISQQVIDNNVLLQWNDCTETLPLDSYELRRGATWATATVIGTKKGGFTTVFETVSGTFTYWLAGIDLAGNYGTPGSVAAVVNQPPDYVLDYDQDSTFSGTKTNTVLQDGVLIVTVSPTETWQDHFTSRSWTTLQDQISAGYPIYAQPSTTTGSYVEEIDFGAVLAGTKITSTLTYAVVSGSTTITPKLSVKETAGGSWIDYAGVDSVYATNFRYLKVTYDFSSSGGDDLLSISNLNVKLDKKLKSDAGTGTANSGDSGGTTVNFNVAFVDIEGISVTPNGTAARIAIYDFVDAPNPTSFKVLLFDTSGNRVTGGFSWQARGT
jgi:predicted phage tail protein